MKLCPFRHKIIHKTDIKVYDDSDIDGFVKEHYDEEVFLPCLGSECSCYDQFYANCGLVHPHP